MPELTPIQLTTRASVRPSAALDPEALTALVAEKAPNPAVMANRELAFWSAEISNNNVDFYGTVMHPDTTLQNFARALNDGISYQDSHDTYKLGWGQSLKGEVIKHSEVVPETGEKRVSVVGTFFTARGLNLAGQNTDDFLDSIGLGIWRDVSVGIAASDVRCSICGEQMMSGFWDDGECLHVPGVEYPGEKGKRILAYGIIMDGELHEVSQVYDGATPNAAVLKATQLADAGKLDNRVAMTLERKYQVRFKTPGGVYVTGAGVPLVGDKPGEKTYSYKPGTPEQGKERNVTRITAYTEEQRDLFRSLSAAEPDAIFATTEDGTEITAGATAQALLAALAEGEDDGEAEATITVVDETFTVLGADERGATETLRDSLTRIKERAVALKADADRAHDLERQVAELTPAALDGKTYRADLITDALAEGVRAIGKDFAEDTYRATLENAPIDFIKQAKRDWQKVGDQRLGLGSDEDDEDAENPRRTRDKASARKPKGYNPAAHKA